jgi:autotransporter-associated beta strand protein
MVDRGTNTTSLLDGAGVLSIVKQGGYSQILSAANNYSGVTHIEAGTLLFGNPTALYNGDSARWTPTNLSVSAGATLALRIGGAAEFSAAAVHAVITNLTAGISNNGLRGGSNIGLEVTAPTLYSNGIGDSTGTGAGALALIKTGVSTLTLDQANSYSGGTQLNNGYLTAAHNSAFGSGPLTLGAGAERVNLANGIQLSNPVVINGSNAGASNGAIQNVGTAAGEIVTLSGAITVNALPGSGGHFAAKNGGTLNLTGPIQSATAVVSVRDGTVTFSGGGSYAAMQVTGTAKLAANNGLATNATLDLGSAGAVGTLDLAGFNQSLAGVTKLTANGAVIGNSSTTADSTLTLTGGGTFAGVIQDSVASGTRKVNLALNGSGQTLVLTGANTYTGDTMVDAGTLSIASPNLADASMVSLATSGSVLRLEFNETAGDVSDTVKKLFIGGVQVAAGVYGATGSGAAIIDDVHFAGSGTLTVTSGPSVAGFDSWIGDNYPLLSDKTPAGDPDQDGIENVLEYVLAGDPSHADLAILPDPAVSATHYLFAFTRRESSALDTTQVFQYGSNLSGWTDVNITAPTGPEVNVGAAVGDLQSVTISIPKSAAVAGKLFGRLKVSK